MPRYMIQASYTAEAAAAFARKPQDRTEGLRNAIQKLGGKMESFDYCLGDYDVVVTFSVADDTTAAALALAVLAPGHLKSYKTTKLLSPEEFRAASEKASGLNYQAPSGD